MKNWTAAMKENVKLDSETLIEFARELKTLNNKDREDYTRILRESGIECTDAPLLAE